MQTNYTRAMAILSSANVAAAFAERRALANTIADAERELDVAAVVLKAVADRVSAATMGVKVGTPYPPTRAHTPGSSGEVLFLKRPAALGCIVLPHVRQLTPSQ